MFRFFYRVLYADNIPGRYDIRRVYLVLRSIYIWLGTLGGWFWFCVGCMTLIYCCLELVALTIFIKEGTVSMLHLCGLR